MTFGDPRLPPRFWVKVVVAESGCWLWVGARARDSYGHYWFVGKQFAHRVAYTALVGAVPDGLQLDHLCRVRHCVNPAHLEPVTCQVNLLRGETVAARRAQATHCVHGHEFLPENTGRTRGGGRYCRTCKRATGRRQREAVRLARQRPGATAAGVVPGDAG